MRPDKYEKAQLEARTRRALFAAFVIPLTLLVLFWYEHTDHALVNPAEPEQGSTLTLNRPKRACPTVQCVTTKGNFSVHLRPHLAPNGTKFIRNLVRAKYFHQHIPFFRVNDVITQFGITRHVPRDEDPFVAFRHGADRDENPYGMSAVLHSDPLLVKVLSFMISMGEDYIFHFVVVIKANRHMGVNRHDAPLGFIPEEDMLRVFDRLYKYNDIVDHPHGPPGVEQGRLMREGMPYIKREFPNTDIILGCSCLT